MGLESLTQLTDERFDSGGRPGVERLEELLDLARDGSGLRMSEHSEIAGELVCNGLRFGSCRLIQVIFGRGTSGAFEALKAIPRCGKVALPKICQQSVDLGVCVWILVHWGGWKPVTGIPHGHFPCDGEGMEVV